MRREEYDLRPNQAERNISALAGRSMDVIELRAIPASVTPSREWLRAMRRRIVTNEKRQAHDLP
jgi:hypothetical protein